MTSQPDRDPRAAGAENATFETALAHATTRWHETNIAIGEASGNGHPEDPYRLAALFEARGAWWSELARLADHEHSEGTVRDVYAIACSYAAELDRHAAAEVRFRYRIPTLHPGSDARRLSLIGDIRHACSKCDRPWQADRRGTCPACPDLIYGITPHSRADVTAYPPGSPWTPPYRREEFDDE